MTGEKSNGPILIIGSERSGSNLLRLILTVHSRIAIPHPPHFMRYLAPVRAAYGDLSVEANRRALVGDALMLLRRHISPWPHAIDPDRVVAAAAPTLFGVAAAIYEEFRLAEGKARWGCKSTFMVDHVDEVLAEYPDARFVWLVREPRDVAASAKRSVFGYCHPYLMAKLWLAQQQRGLAALRRWGPQVVHLVRYEDFVTDPEHEVARLCRFVGERVEPLMLQHHRSPTAIRIAGMSESWRRAGEPISTRRVGTSALGLTARERLQVDRVTAELKEELGYDVDPRCAHVAPPSMADIVLRSAVSRIRVEFRSLRHDRNWWQRWARDATVRWIRLKARSLGAS